MLARMVVDMRGPEPADAVAGAVNAVIGEIVEHETQRPGPPAPTYLEHAELIGGDKDGKRKAAEQHACHRRTEPERERHQRILGPIGLGCTEIGRAHDCTPLTNEHLVCSLMQEKEKNTTSLENIIHD